MTPDKTQPDGAAPAAPSYPGAGPRPGESLPFAIAALVFLRERGILRG